MNSFYDDKKKKINGWKSQEKQLNLEKITEKYLPKMTFNFEKEERMIEANRFQPVFLTKN
jgi:hypothetical protein